MALFLQLVDLTPRVIKQMYRSAVHLVSLKSNYATTAKRERAYNCAATQLYSWRWVQEMYCINYLLSGRAHVLLLYTSYYLVYTSLYLVYTSLYLVYTSLYLVQSRKVAKSRIIMTRDYTCWKWWKQCGAYVPVISLVPGVSSQPVPLLVQLRYLCINNYTLLLLFVDTIQWWTRYNFTIAKRGDLVTQFLRKTSQTRFHLFTHVCNP